MKSLFLLTVALLFACNGKLQKQEADPNTKVFSYYLRTAFNDSIPQEKRLYILVPKNGCKGCRSGALYEVRNSISPAQANEVITIVAPDLGYIDSLLPGKVYHDTDDLIDRINFPVSNITLVKTENGKITSLRQVRTETIDSIPYFLK
jgi:hypothetical protein